MHTSTAPQMRVSLSSAEKETLIANHPLFCLLNPLEIREFAQILKEMRVNPGTVITQQGAIVDNLYLIASGTASVTKKVVTIERNNDIPVATLHEGDAIGLSSIGIYSHTGVRTANVTAITPMKLFAIDIQDFYRFLQRPDVNYPALQNTTEKILLMQFIQGTHLFGYLTKEEIQHLAHGIKKIVVKQGTYLFKEGDLAEKYYFILSGRISISTTIDQKEHVLKVLESSSLFGEGAFLDQGKRNANAIANNESELFVLDKSQLDALNQNLAQIQSFGKRIKQIRPVRKPDIDVSQTRSPEGDIIMTLCDKHQPVLRLSKMEKALWDEIDGINTLNDIFNKEKNEFRGLTVLDFYTALLKMKKLGLVSFQDLGIKLLVLLKNTIAGLAKRLKFLRRKKEK